jgi:hypothetical protein
LDEDFRRDAKLKRTDGQMKHNPLAGGGNLGELSAWDGRASPHGTPAVVISIPVRDGGVNAVGLRHVCVGSADRSKHFQDEK